MVKQQQFCKTVTKVQIQLLLLYWAASALPWLIQYPPTYSCFYGKFILHIPTLGFQ